MSSYDIDDIKTLTDEQVIDILKRLTPESTERQYFLDLSFMTNNCHPVSIYREDYDVILGNVKSIVKHRRQDQCYDIDDIVFIPMTNKVVIHVYSSGGQPQDRFDRLYVFSFDKGWQTVRW